MTSLMTDQTQRSSIATTVALISFSMLFATFFLAYAILRGAAVSWPPPGYTDIPFLYPVVSTLLIMASSLTYHLGHKKLVNGARQSIFTKYLSITLGLGFAFLVVQFLLWSSLQALGIVSSSGLLGTILYSFTWLHAAHLVMGLLALTYLLIYRLFRPTHSLSTDLTLSIGKFWHFLTVIWLIMFFILFVF